MLKKQLSTGNCPFAARNSEGLTALEVARLNGSDEVVEMLLGFLEGGRRKILEKSFFLDLLRDF